MQQEIVVNNFEIIKNILDFSGAKEGFFYYIQLTVRKKDVGGAAVGNTNNNYRTVKTYDIYTLQDLEEKQQEIIDICNVRSCRAGINLNRKSDENVTFLANERLAKQMKAKKYRNNDLLNKVKGIKDSRIEKNRWIVDVDSPSDLGYALAILNSNTLRGDNTKRVISILPTYSGHHIITTPFDRATFDKAMEVHGSKIEIHTNNPAALYYPPKTIDLP